MKKRMGKKEKKQVTKISPILIPWIVFGILIALTSTLVLPTKVISYQIDVPYIEKENYTVEVPYETVEPYTVQVPYETKEQYVESVPYTEEETVNSNYCDNTAGCRCLTTHWFWGYCTSCSCTVTKYKDVIKERTVTKYRDETRYQTVTKTRTEIREREVRKTRTETKQKEVNWLFGFDAVIKFRDLG